MFEITRPALPRSTFPALRRAAAAALLCGTASAGFTNPYTPAFRGGIDTQYGGWESFTIPSGGPNAPDDPQSTSSQAGFEQLVSGAIITGTGNIYHPGAAQAFRLADTVPADLQELFLQVSTEGTELAYTSAALHYVDGQGQAQNVPYTSYTELARTTTMGVSVESLYRWDLESIPDAISSYTITFEAAAAHLSLDALLLDTRFGPPEGTFVPYCFPGMNGVRTCPCANPPSRPGRGCNNFGAMSGGARLSGAGTASISSDSMTFTSTGENPTSLTVIIQGPALTPVGLPFGAGVRCVTGSLKRLYTGAASGGTIVRPGPLDPSVSSRSATLGDPLAAGDTRYYVAYYRDPQATGPCGSPSQTYNSTQGGRITWLP